MAFARYALYLLKITRGSAKRRKEIVFSLKESFMVSDLSDVHVEILPETEYFNKYKLSNNYYGTVVELFRLPLYAWHLWANNIPKRITYDCLIALFVVRKFSEMSVEHVLFFGFSYHMEMAMISMLAKDQGIYCSYYMNAGFVDDSDGVIANSVYVRSAIQKKYIKKYGKNFKCDIIKCVREIVLTKTLEVDTLGVYFSGFYARQHSAIHVGEFIKKGVAAEAGLQELIRGFALKYPDIEVIIYPHYHNGVETYISAIESYKKLLELPNVVLNTPDKKSKEDFRNVNLGITAVSAIFFDRIESGYKCCLVDCYAEMCENGWLDSLMVSDESDIYTLLRKGPSEYFQNLVNIL